MQVLAAPLAERQYTADGRGTNSSCSVNCESLETGKKSKGKALRKESPSRAWSTVRWGVDTLMA